MPPTPATLASLPTESGVETASGNNAWYIYHSARHVAGLDQHSRAEGVAGAERDIDFLLRQLALMPTDRLLEIGCGWGRHSLILHGRGYRNLTSVDIAPAMLAVARERASAAGSATDFRRCDFRDLGDEPPFDAILSAYDRSCLGYPTEEEDRASLAFLHHLLRPGGQLFFGIGDWPVALPGPRRDWREWDGVVELLETIPDAAAMTCTDRTTVLYPTGRRVYTLTRRHYSLPEVRRLLAEAGFAFVAAWHALDAARVYGPEQDGLFVLARREGV
jgi:SAM-dependent methyltransferase